jgi:hypothetical protein
MVSIGSIVSIGRGVRAGVEARPYERMCVVMETAVNVRQSDGGRAWGPALSFGEV